MTEGFPTIVTSRRLVPNAFPPAEPYPYRIAIIGEAPGEDEENVCYPFVGRSGKYLNAKLADAGIDRNRCFTGNVCQVRPPGNRIEAFPWDGEEIQNGLKQLRLDIEQFQPNICVLLGNTPLRAARGESKVSKLRGSLFRGSVDSSPFYQKKCVASLHPAFVLREFSGNPLLGFDLVRARQEGETSELSLPSRELNPDLDPGTILHLLETWPSGLRCSVDIEGGLPNWAVNDGVRKDSKKRRHIGWRCVALSASPTKAFAIPWWKFSEPDHARILQAFARLMYREDVPKVLQNSLYDCFVLAFGYGCPIRGVAEDTMLKGWEVYSELPKGLGTQASIWTREPFWKDEDMYESTGDALAVGCCKDTAVTLEICNAQDAALDAAGRTHYYKNIEMLQPLLYMELRGIKYDQENVARHLREVRTTGWDEVKDGVTIHHKPIAVVGEELCQMAGTELRGDGGSLSAKRLAKCLYETKKYPPQYKKENGRLTTKLTTDVEAILSLRKKLPSDQFLDGILRHRHLEGILETLSIKPDADGRVRCGYNVVGTETGRLTCYTSPTGAGANLQTITKKLRKNYIADAGYDFFQCDLSGADGWTVAAHCEKLGDDTMLRDYVAGLKPAKIIAGLHCFGSEFNELDRESLVFWGDEERFTCISKVVGTGIYDCAKQIQHGSNYLMGIPTMQKNIMIKSFKQSGTPIYMEHRDGKHLQGLYFSRYPGVRTWHQFSEAQVVAFGKLTSASGHTRIFFGRRQGPNIHDTVAEYLADEPQQNTTWATNLAMLNLWNDPENRKGGVVLKNAWDTWIATLEGQPGALLIEPLHSVHDALCGQCHTTLRPWATTKLKQWFNNTLRIANMDIVIPFEGAFGPSWGVTPHKI